MTPQFNSKKNSLSMLNDNINSLFTIDILTNLLPPDRADVFFDALYGDVDEGAYDIKLQFSNYVAEKNTLTFELHLTERPGKCLACNLTYGLPEVFSRHPRINIQGMVDKIEVMLDGQAKCLDWKLGSTQTESDNLHTIPLTIYLG
jgi:hypothetical protein